MRFRDQVALTLPALLLRLVLAIIFLWAGIGKFASSAIVSGDDAARLSNMGVELSPLVPQTIEPALPINDLPDPDADPEPPTDAQTNPLPDQESGAADPLLENSEDQQRLQEILDEARRRADQAQEDDAGSATDPITDDPQTNEEPTERISAFPGSTFSMIPAQLEGTPASASDFPEPMSVLRVYKVALLLNKCADPGLTSESQPIDPILPSMFASGGWAKALAIAAAVTECVAGFLLLIGFMTRISAIGTLSVMLVALWTTQFGPAAIQGAGAGDPILGFIPNYGEFWNASLYTSLFLQLAMAAMSTAVFFLGSGPVGMDRLIFGKSKRDKYIHGDPKAGAPTNARDPFDRSPNPTP